MYSRERPFRVENYKPKKSHKNTPSFSSTLLDEIYRSIDDGNGDGFRAMSCSINGDEEMSRACLVENWMEKEEKVVTKTRRTSLIMSERENTNDDLLFFSSNSSSSDSSSGALSSSSDTEFFGSTTKNSKYSKVSCFSTKPKPVRTGRFSSPDDHNQRIDGAEDDDSSKNKSRALNFYANLKKVKQPISPGARLTNFISSIFSNNYIKSKKSRNLDSDKGFEFDQDLRSKAKTSSLSSTCSSASSFSRSCLSKDPSQSRDKIRDGMQRTVRFNLVDGEDCERYIGRPPLPPNAQNVLKGYRNREFSVFRKIRDEDEDGDEDAVSDSSSDLFELDHLALFGNNRFCEELPVYETTTYFDKNRGLIR